MISVSEVISSPEFAQIFIVYRSIGSFVDGVWTESTPRAITMRGVVTVSSSRELEQLPEGDRVRGAMTFHTLFPIYVTRTGNSAGTSDKILWRGEYYKLVNVYPEVDYGYWKGIGVRIKGA
jgi:hypothetical protein